MEEAPELVKFLAVKPPNDARVDNVEDEIAELMVADSGSWFSLSSSSRLTQKELLY